MSKLQGLRDSLSNGIDIQRTNLSNTSVNINVNNSSILKLEPWQIKSINIPGFNNNVLTIKRFDTFYNLPRRGIKWNDLNISVFEDEKLKVYEGISALLKEFPIGEVLTGDYKKYKDAITVTLEMVKNSDLTTTKIINFKNVVLRGISDLQLDSETEGLSIFVITFGVSFAGDN